MDLREGGKRFPQTRQRLAIQNPVLGTASYGEGGCSLTPPAQEAYGNEPLLDTTRLADAPAVEAHKVRELTGKPAEQNLSTMESGAQSVRELEKLRSHAGSPPNTSTPANRHAGAAWPT